jgi:DNA invertase Pin-like site-specific DNA recombinase
MLVDGYVRVSDVRGRAGESFISPADQAEQILAWAAMRGAEIGRVFEELDVSGARSDRPLLEQAVRRIEEGSSDGLVVAKLDRFGRSLMHGLMAVERIQAAGGTFVSVQNGFDISTDQGRLVLRLMLSWAEWELDRIRAGWRTARARAVARGVHMGGKAPAGYKHDDSRRLRPHPQHGTVVGEAFALRADGMTLEQVAAFITSASVPTAYGDGGWTVAGLRYLLANRVYLGELRNGEFVLEDAHPAITDPVTWQRAQAPRLRSRRAPGQPTPLGGLVRCGTCERVMQSHSVVRNGRRHRTYVCRRDDCAHRIHVSGAVLEPHVEACFFALLDERSVPSEVETLEAEAATAHEALVAFRDDQAIQDALGPEHFTAGLATRVERERRALGAVAAARDRLRLLEPGGRDLWEERWPRLSVVERREAIARLLDDIRVARGAAPVQERVAVVARGGDFVVNPPPERARWEERRIEVELRAFATDGWPDSDAFISAGRGPLLAQIHATGGPVRWSRRISLAATCRRGHWTDERIRATLARLLDGRRTWPTRRELTAMGYDGLYGAMARRGRREWEREFGFAGRPGLAGPTRWTEPNVLAALEDLTRGRDSYPSRAEFQAAGLDGLHQAIRSHHGGHAAWAQRLGLPRAAGRPHSKSVLRWTDALVEPRLRVLVCDLALDRYPLHREFVEAGEGGLYRHIKTTAGHALWARRLGLPRPTERRRGRATSQAGIMSQVSR